MKKLFSLAFIILICISCNDNKNTLPEGIIPRDSMIVILADIHIAEAKLQNAGPAFRDKTFKSAYLQQVLRKAGVDSSRFLGSFDYYSSHPEIFSIMYEQVIVEISKRQAVKLKE